MSRFTKEDLKVLQKLCRIRLTDAEEDRFVKSVSAILEHVAKLSEVDTEDTEPCRHVFEDMTAPLREDEPERLISRERFLKDAPEHVGGMIKVPKVIHDLS